MSLPTWHFQFREREDFWKRFFDALSVTLNDELDLAKTKSEELIARKEDLRFLYSSIKTPKRNGEKGFIVPDPEVIGLVKLLGRWYLPARLSEACVQKNDFFVGQAILDLLFEEPVVRLKFTEIQFDTNWIWTWTCGSGRSARDFDLVLQECIFR